MRIETGENSFLLSAETGVLLKHTPRHPLIYVGMGRENVEMYRGNFKIQDYVEMRYPLQLTSVVVENGEYRLDFDGKITANVKLENQLITIDFEQCDSRINRFWICIAADEAEKCYGCVEQMSHFNLRGRNFPIWTSKPGVGRDKTTYVTCAPM